VPRIFICYRRDDTAGHTGRLRDALSAAFGAGEIFRDLDTIAPGDDFVDAMSHGVATCSVFLAIVGRQWLTATDRNGHRRLDDPDDHVRTELAEALTSGVRVIPVLVQGAAMPAAADLPDPIKPFAVRNAIELDDDGWESDVRRLVEAIRRDLRMPPAARRPVTGARSRWGAALAVVAVGALVAGGLFVRGRVAPITQSPPSGGSRPDDTSTSGRDARGTPPHAGPQVLASLPGGGEAALGGLVYEVLDAGVETRAGRRVLTLRVRLTNHGRFPTTFSPAHFRLHVDGDVRAPDGGDTDVVPAEAAQDKSLAFAVPADASRATLRIGDATATADIPLDLTGRTGPTATQDRDLRRSGKRTVAVPIDPASSRARFGDVTCELRSASVHRYAHKLTLTLHVRLHNGGRFDTNFWDSSFRLMVDDTPRAPVSGLDAIVAAHSAGDGDIIFDLPLDANDVTLRIIWGDATANVPLRIPPTA
jgi:TIR domain-containing protein